MAKSVMFTVTGRFPFPVDMLRYDACWPDSSVAAAQLAASIKGDEPCPAEGWRVTLIGAGGPPTVARWESFLWRVVK